MLLCLVVVGYGVQAAGLNQTNATHQTHRPAYHFQPVKNWMNDPNGPMYYKGVYHLFYQHNPHAVVLDNITWGHSVSYDLVNWVHLENALNPTEPYDIGGCWTGSATMLPGGTPVVLYTGADNKKFQSQNLAFPKDPADPLLRKWVKSPLNPVITAIDGDIDPNNFRDPTTAWQDPDGTWHVLIGGKIDGRGMAFLYRSKDFVNWTRIEKPLHSSARTGMWECPDFYPVNMNGKKGVENYLESGNVKYVLKASLLDHDHYILGHYNTEMNEFEVETASFMEATDWRYDYGGKFYASKTFFDGKKQRRILWGWVQESNGPVDDIKKGWSGVQSIPRVLWLSASGKQLVQWPIEEIESLRAEKVELELEELKGGSLIEVVGITALQADVEVSFELANLEDAEEMKPGWVDPQLLCTQKNATVKGTVGPFGLLVLASKDLREKTAIFFRVFKNHGKHVVLMCSDLSRSSLRKEVDKTSFGVFVDIDPRQENISLRTLIDHSIVESFGGEGKACITARAYPVLAVDGEAKLLAFNNGSISVKMPKLNAWSMKAAMKVPFTERTKLPA